MKMTPELEAALIEVRKASIAYREEYALPKRGRSGMRTSIDGQLRNAYETVRNIVDPDPIDAEVA
jgi:hypothetical protein